jgi:hypothetical protein
MARRRRSRPGEPRTCLTPGCGAAIAAWKRLCDPCFARLPRPRRKAIIEARQARAPHLVQQHSRAAAEWLAKHSPAAEAARRLGEREPVPGGVDQPEQEEKL